MGDDYRCMDRGFRFRLLQPIPDLVQALIYGGSCNLRYGWMRIHCCRFAGTQADLQDGASQGMCTSICDLLETDDASHLQVLVLAAAYQMTAQITLCTSPPFPLFLVVHTLFGFGWALQFSHYNSYAVSLDKPHQKLGLLHAGTGIGAAIMPLASTPFSARYRFFWFYGISLGLTSFTLVCLVLAFKGKDGELHESGPASEKTDARYDYRRMYRLPHIWHCGAIYFLFVVCPLSQPFSCIV